MNILFITEDHSTENYGVTTMLSQLADQLVQLHEDMTVVIAATGHIAVPQHERVKVKLIPPARWASPWRWSPGLSNRIRNLVSQYQIDLIHIHGIWSAGPWAGLRVARLLQIPVVVSLHGMWEQWFWQEDNLLRIFKKKMYFKGILRHAISHKVIVHAITPREKENIRHLLPYNKIVLIPNSIHVEQSVPVKSELEKMILFLGRLHPKKGVELLLRAFSLAKLEKEWHLVIAGPEEVSAYSQMLKNETARLGLSCQVEFIGPIFGDKKWDLVRKAWVMAVPSYSEVVGMVNLEAATCGVPSITTYPTGLWDWQDGGGLLIKPDVNALTNSLIQACGWSKEERYERGKRSHQLVVEKYSWDAVMPQWEKLYAAERNQM